MTLKPSSRFLIFGLILLALLFSATASFADTVTGVVQNAQGGPLANGTFSLALTQPAVISGTATIVPSPVNCYTDAAGNVVGEPNPLQLPVATPNLASGTLPAGTYYVEITYFDSTGESAPSPELTFVLSSAGTLNVTAPTKQPASASGYKVYIGTASGAETLQGSVTGTPGSWGNFSQAAALAAGTALPVSNSSVCKVHFNDELQPSFVCYDVGLVTQSGVSVPGYPQYWYLSGGSSGTVNVSQGTPQSNVCQGAGVVYPQAIVTTPAAGATQSINGDLSLGSNSLTAGAAILARLMGICDANTYAGSDAGAKINAAELDANCIAVDATNLTSPSAAATVQATKPLYLGTYTLSVAGSPGINIGNHSELIGKGRHNTIISTSSATADVIFGNAGNDYSQASGFTIQSSVLRTAGAGLHIQSGHGIYRDIEIDPVFDGIKLDVASSADVNYFDSITMTRNDGSGAAWHCGILNGGVPTGTVSGNFFHNILISSDPTTFSDAMMCIQDGSDGIAISDSQFVHGAGDSVALHLERVNGGNAPEWIKCTNCYFEGGPTANGVVVDSALTFDCFNCYSVSGLNGVVLNSGTDIKWYGGQIYNNQQHGLHDVGAIDVHVDGVRFADNSQATNNTYDDVLVDAGVNNFRISGNTFATLVSPTNKPKWNVEIAAGASNNYYIANNIMPGSAATGALSDSGTGTTKLVQSSSQFNIGKAPLVLMGSSSGQATIQAPAVAATPTLTTPTTTGTLGLTSGSQQFAFSCTGTATAASTLFINNAGVTTCTTAGANPTSIAAVAGTLSNLQVKCGTGGVNASSGVFTAVVNSSSTSLTCTLGTGTSCSDTTHTAAVTAGQTIQMRYTTQTAETLANCTATFVQN